MAKLTKAESTAILRLFIRSQNILKGKALDMARLAFPVSKEDRQHREFQKTLRGLEATLRRNFIDSLLESGIIEAVPQDELSTYK